jgi:hypothetical protein
MDNQKQLREHLLELLEGRSAHIDTESGLEKFPETKINVRIENSPHTAWELLEHFRIAQWDIIEFSHNAKHVTPEWPDGFWPKKKGTAADWKRSVRQILKDLQTMRDLVADTKNDLYAPIRWGTGQTLLREAMLLADHNAYHLGQIVLLRRILEKP